MPNYPPLKGGSGSGPMNPSPARRKKKKAITPTAGRVKPPVRGAAGLTYSTNPIGVRQPPVSTPKPRKPKY